MKISDQFLQELFQMLDQPHLGTIPVDNLLNDYKMILNRLTGQSEEFATMLVLRQLLVEPRWLDKPVQPLVIMFLLFSSYGTARIEHHSMATYFMDMLKDLDNPVIPGTRCSTDNPMETCCSVTDEKVTVLKNCMFQKKRMLDLLQCLLVTNGIVPVEMRQKNITEATDCMMMEYNQKRTAHHFQIRELRKTIESKRRNMSCLDYTSVPALFPMKPDEPFSDVGGLVGEKASARSTLSNRRMSYFRFIAASENAPLFKSFVCPEINPPPSILSLNEGQLDFVIPEIVEFSELLWDQRLDDLVCNSANGKKLLKRSTEITLDISENDDLLTWIKSVLGSLDVPKLLYRHPHRMHRMGLTPVVFQKMCGYNPHVAGQIFKHGIIHFDMSQYLRRLIDSVGLASDIDTAQREILQGESDGVTPNNGASTMTGKQKAEKRCAYVENRLDDPDLIQITLNRFEVLRQVFAMAEVCHHYFQVFVTNLIDRCDYSLSHDTENKNKLARVLCETVERLMRRKTTLTLIDEVNIDPMPALNSLGEQIEAFCILQRGVVEAVDLYQLICEMKGGNNTTVAKSTDDQINNTPLQFGIRPEKQNKLTKVASVPQTATEAAKPPPAVARQHDPPSQGSQKPPKQQSTANNGNRGKKNIAGLGRVEEQQQSQYSKSQRKKGRKNR